MLVDRSATPVSYTHLDILADQLFVQQNSVLIVVAFPGHEADQSVLAQRDLAVLGSGAVSQNVALLDNLSLIHILTGLDQLQVGFACINAFLNLLVLDHHIAAVDNAARCV